MDTGTVRYPVDAVALSAAAVVAVAAGGHRAGIALANKRTAPIDCSVLVEFPIGARPT